MTWYERIIACHTAVTNAVSHAKRLKSDRYFVWMEDGRNDFKSGNHHAEKAVEGTTDLYTKTEFDPWAAQFEAALDADGSIAWYLNLTDYDEDSGLWHYEWVWQVPMEV